MPIRRPAAEPRPAGLRIGEVARSVGLTTRTLRYWEELGLVTPDTRAGNGERRYSPADVTRATRIRDLQDLLGFSLAEVRVVLDTEDVGVLDRVRSELHSGHPSPERRRDLLDEAVAANDQLLGRLDDTLSRIRAFRVERAEVAERLRARRDEVEEELGRTGGAAGSVPAARGAARR